MSQAAMNQATMHSPRLDDLRGALAAQASRAEQRNRPRALVIGAVIVLAIGAWFAWAGWQRNTDAARDARAAQQNAEKTLDAAGRLRAMMADDGHGGVQAHVPMTSLLSRIEALGIRAGLKARVPIGTTNVKRENLLRWNQVKTSYIIKDESMNAVLSWVNMVVAEVPGMEVHSITVRPDATEWVVTVIFSRWEKPEGGS